MSNDDGTIDHTKRLGFLNMPPGYKLLQLDSGHFIFEREVDEVESVIHWNKWAVRKWAWFDYLNPETQTTTPQPEGQGAEGQGA